MDKLIKWLENSFAPKLQKITNLTWIVVIKDSVMQLLPFILAGSIFCVGTILNDYIPALPSFWTPFGWTMSKIGLMASYDKISRAAPVVCQTDRRRYGAWHQ